MSKAAIKTNNDSSLLESKIILRIESLPDKKQIKVLEAFGGEGVLWKEVRKRTDKKIKILSIDANKYKRVQLQGDNIKFLKSFDLKEFDIIDLDAWGSPFKQLQIIFEKQFKGIVHCTFIQTMHGGMNKELLYANGYTKNMVEKIPSLFSRNGVDKLMNYIYSKGIRSVKIISEKRKNYFWFKIA